MQSLNKVTLIGNLGKEPQYMLLEGNLQLAKFQLATSETYNDKDGKMQTATEWHSIIAWRALAETARKYLHKGSRIYIEGKIKTRSYDDKDGNKKLVTEIIADVIILLDKKTGMDAPAENDATPQAAKTTKKKKDSDLPF